MAFHLFLCKIENSRCVSVCWWSWLAKDDCFIIEMVRQWTARLPSRFMDGICGVWTSVRVWANTYTYIAIWSAMAIGQWSCSCLMHINKIRRLASISRNKSIAKFTRFVCRAEHFFDGPADGHYEHVCMCLCANGLSDILGCMMANAIWIMAISNFWLVGKRTDDTIELSRNGLGHMGQYFI